MQDDRCDARRPPTDQTAGGELPSNVHAYSTSALPRSRSDGKSIVQPGVPSMIMLTLLCPESWIEVSSQPSSSSLSSAADEIITTGLRVGHGSSLRRRRRLRRSEVGRPHIRNTSGTSSQEEYEESESESDRVMSSSNEAVQASPLHEQRWPGSDQPVSSASSADLAFAAGEQEETDE